MNKAKLIEKLKRASCAIYIATEEEVADDISALMKDAIKALQDMEWKPIEEAPESTPVYITNGDYEILAKLAVVDYSEFRGESLWGWVGCGCHFEYSDDPTHYRLKEAE